MTFNEAFNEASRPVLAGRLVSEATVKRLSDDTTPARGRQPGAPSLLVRLHAHGPDFFINARDLAEEHALQRLVARIREALASPRRRERRGQLPSWRGVR